MINHSLRAASLAAAIGLLTLGAAVPSTDARAAPTSDAGRSAEHARIVEFWTPERRAQAIPRDLLLDDAGNAFLALPNGGLVPYGRAANGRAGQPVPMAKPGGGGSGGGGTRLVTNAAWTVPGTLQTAAGRILFELSDGYYVCSGTVVQDGAGTRSLILTAAHCIYDDANKAFATNVLFIPNQDQTTGTGSDFDCGNDPLGCWTPNAAVVDTNWTIRQFPDNIPWDYGFYVVPTSGAHSGKAANDSLEIAAGAMPISFDPPTTGIYTHALGYSYSNDPLFMYCAEGLSTNGTANWWLGKCGLSGGSSGGPWIQSPSLPTTGSGTVFSVNSWGYTTRSGMAGPKLNGTSAQCLRNLAQTTSGNAAGGC
jgi:hypothetical protein